MKKIRKYLFQALIISFITLSVFEVAYRYQLIDFYATGWQYLNSNVDKESELPKILVLGDSFSAGDKTWVSDLNKSKKFVAYNSSVPGIGVETFNFLLSSRLKEVQPDIVILQLYVGNDLYDINKPVNWQTFNLSRNLFWSVSNHFRSLNYLNYKAGQVSQDVVGNVDPKTVQGFNEKLYSSRTKMYIQGDVNYPQNSILLDESVEPEFEELKSGIEKIRSEVPEDIPIYVLVVPHCTQLDTFYVDNYRKLGAEIKGSVVGSSRWCENLAIDGMSIINPVHILSQFDSPKERAYLVNDPHLTDQGQRVLGDFVLNELLK